MIMKLIIMKANKSCGSTCIVLTKIIFNHTNPPFKKCKDLGICYKQTFLLIYNYYVFKLGIFKIKYLWVSWSNLFFFCFVFVFAGNV